MEILHTICWWCLMKPETALQVCTFYMAIFTYKMVIFQFTNKVEFLHTAPMLIGRRCYGNMTWKAAGEWRQSMSDLVYANRKWWRNSATRYDIRLRFIAKFVYIFVTSLEIVSIRVYSREVMTKTLDLWSLSAVHAFLLLVINNWRHLVSEWVSSSWYPKQWQTMNWRWRPTSSSTIDCRWVTSNLHTFRIL